MTKRVSASASASASRSWPNDPVTLQIRQSALKGLRKALDCGKDWSHSQSIELSVFEMHGTKRRLYCQKIRSMIFNVRNPNLRAQIISGKITPPQLVKMTHRQLNPLVWEETDRIIEEREVGFQKTRKLMVQDPTDQDPKSSESSEEQGMFKCRKCRSWKTSFTLLQTRSADESMTAFHLCEECGHRWRSC